MENMEKHYSPNDIEDKWYKFWEEKGYFHAEVDKTKPSYSIVIPPPNVTGVLHMGHVLNNSIQDTLIRWKRMQGYNALWMPGTDHAGIATQNKVERKLAKENKTRHDVGREKFLELVWEWKEEHGGKITNQLRKLGASLDWERERFTMDEKLQNSVKEIFVDLYEDDLIYRGEYMVNWCPRCGTALADDEVEHVDLGSFIWSIKYPIKDSDEEIIIATTRPETILGDTAIAVNPEDDRFKHLVGKTAIIPLVNKEIPIIADDYVDMEFGTGALKITPAHDPNDFELGKKHNLEIINIFTDDAKLNKNVDEEYQGLDRFEAREKILADLDKNDFFAGKKALEHPVGHCYRCDTPIEPKISMQWFVSMKGMAEDALKVVRDKEIDIFPKKWEKVYYNWLENIRDWCISRQIWWGHRIPAYYCDECDHIMVSKEKPEKCSKCGSKKVTQETDVLDTWFSSWLWPLSTLGWPEKTEELEYFYPTNTIVTGADILFFWVARMVMAGKYIKDEIPFENIFLHGIVRDKKGRKMSKSLGNSPDPIEVIKEYGADAMRFSMLYNTSKGQDVFYSNKLIEMGRNFANKIWNVSRFALMHLENFKPEEIDVNNLELELQDHWILTKLNLAIKKTNKNLEEFNLDTAAQGIYDFIWGDFCDWYIEISKDRLYNEDEEQKRKTAQFVLWFVLDQGLKLLHPFMPFITEEIWKRLPDSGESIMISDYPETDENMINLEIKAKMEFIQDVISRIRNIRGDMSISLGRKLNIIFKSNDGEEEVLLRENMKTIVNMANLSNVEIDCNAKKPKMSATSVVGETEIYAPLEGVIDIEKEKKRLEKNISDLEKDLKRSTGKLSNENFVSKAPKEVVEKEKSKKKEFEDKIEKLTKNLEILK
ncbi:MAG: valine--tRNA ligase [Fusobacteriota bacterium]